VSCAVSEIKIVVDKVHGGREAAWSLSRDLGAMVVVWRWWLGRGIVEDLRRTCNTITGLPELGAGGSGGATGEVGGCR
jgi:hypothetical protein